MELVSQAVAAPLQLVRPPLIDPLDSRTIPCPAGPTGNPFVVQMSNNCFPSQLFLRSEPYDESDDFHFGGIDDEPVIYNTEAKRRIGVAVVILPTPVSGRRTNTFLSKSSQDGLL